MDCLIDASTRQWDEDMIDGIFLPQEAEIIKKIPLAVTTSADYLVWSYSQDGNYSCKSRYRFLKEVTYWDEMDEASNQDGEFWNGIWSLNSPNKVKILIW